MAQGQGDDDGSGKEGVGFKLFGVEISVADELSNKSSSESLNLQKKRSHEDGGDDNDRLRKSKSMGNLQEMCNQSGGGGGGGGAAAAAGAVDDSGYHSDGVLHVNSRRAAHMRRKGINSLLCGCLCFIRL